MDSFLTVLYMRPVRIIAIVANVIAVVSAGLYVASIEIPLIVVVGLSLCIAIAVFEIILSVSVYIVSKSGVERILAIMMQTTRKRQYRPYVYSAEIIVCLLAVAKLLSNGTTTISSLGILLLIMLVVDKTVSIYMSFVISLIADKEDYDKKR